MCHSTKKKCLLFKRLLMTFLLCVKTKWAKSGGHNASTLTAYAPANCLDMGRRSAEAIGTEIVARQQLSRYTTALGASRDKNAKLIKARKAFRSGPVCPWLHVKKIKHEYMFRSYSVHLHYCLIFVNFSNYTCLKQGFSSVTSIKSVSLLENELNSRLKCGLLHCVK